MNGRPFENEHLSHQRDGLAIAVLGANANGVGSLIRG